MCSHHLPSVIPLFTSQNSPSSTDICGEDIRTIDDLPSLLWGARLDASSFVHETLENRLPLATESWSAIWKTPDEEDILKLSWDLSKGWMITYAHQGKEFLSAQGEAQAPLSGVVEAHHAAFADALARQLWNIESQWAEKVDNGKRADKRDSECRMDLVIPVCTTSVLSAVKAVAELVTAFEETRPTTFIELHPVLGVWREAGSDYWRVLRRNWNATGLPSYGPPKFNGAEISILRYVLALHVRVPLARVIAAHARLMETIGETVAQGLEAGLPGPMLVPMCVGAEDCKYEQIVNGMRHEWLPVPLKGGLDRLLEDKETGTCLQELVAADLAASKGILAYFVDKPTLERRLFTEQMAQACLAEVQRMERQRPKAAEPVIEIDEAALEAAPLEFDARLKSVVESPKRVLFANLLLNPFGPTLVYVFVLKSDAQAGRTANLYQAALQPQQPEYRCIGRIVFPKTWLGDWDNETLKKLAASLTGTDLGTVLPPLWLAPSQRRELLASLYARDEDASRSLAVLEQAPDDIYKRFDIELEGLDQALLKPEQKARETLIDLSLTQAFAAREVGHFLQCWSHCERFFLHGNVSLAFALLKWIISADLKKEVAGF